MKRTDIMNPFSFLIKNKICQQSLAFLFPIALRASPVAMAEGDFLALVDFVLTLDFFIKVVNI
jgi:hypothetical protein